MIEIKSFRELPVDWLAKIGIELFSENFETSIENRTLHAKLLYEELYERTVIDVPFTDNKGNVLVGFNGYLITLMKIRKQLGINKNDFEHSEHTLNSLQKEKLIGVIKGLYDYEAVKQRLIIPNTYSYTNDIKTKNLDTQLLFVFENLYFLQDPLRSLLGLTNITHFMSRAEIAFELILRLCDTDENKIESIAKKILYETKQKTYNPYFTHTHKLIKKYYQQGFRGTAISEIVDGLNCGGNRHRTEGALYTKKLEFMPQYLSREVYELLDEYLNPKDKEMRNSDKIKLHITPTQLTELVMALIENGHFKKTEYDTEEKLYKYLFEVFEIESFMFHQVKTKLRNRNTTEKFLPELSNSFKTAIQKLRDKKD